MVRFNAVGDRNGTFVLLNFVAPDGTTATVRDETTQTCETVVVAGENEGGDVLEYPLRSILYPGNLRAVELSAVFYLRNLTALPTSTDNSGLSFRTQPVLELQKDNGLPYQATDSSLVVTAAFSPVPVSITGTEATPNAVCGRWDGVGDFTSWSDAQGTAHQRESVCRYFRCNALPCGCGTVPGRSIVGGYRCGCTGGPGGGGVGGGRQRWDGARPGP